MVRSAIAGQSVRRAGVAVVVLAVAMGVSACVGKGDSVTPTPPTTAMVGNTEVFTYQLVCPSPVGDLSTAIQFTVTDSLEELKTGETVTYTIEAPLAQVKAPVTPTFESSTTTYAIPTGFTVTSAHLDPASNSDFTSSSTNVTDTSVSFTINGSFPINGTPRDVPLLEIEGKVTAASGEQIVWSTPTSIVGKASVPLLGSQSSTCTFPTTGTVGTTTVK